ncbi:PAS domain S-box protein [Persicimonas caeni]|uniref:histidine kinase n=1 Tax=Persicimonas caeni TaxID=2292766 RepID=A0A4Y6PS34_PERCE|nr:ATP-binding protein [Persicimonas caeni]QDG50595.1 PAS domain S-box protein [Persicimonas caeni]QED31816.1 PAS domain S-box protein [Persicimonas caeni]
MKQRDFKVLVLGSLPEADDLFERGVFKDEYPCEPVRVENPEEFGRAVREPTFDLILIDVEPHGINVLRSVLDERPMRPMIMVADAAQGDVILEAKRLGLERYVMRLSDDVLNADLLAEEMVFILQRLSEPPSMEHPTVEELFRFAQYHNVRQPFFVIDRNHRLLYTNASGKALVKAVHDHDLREGDQYDRFPLTGSTQESTSHLNEALGGSEVEIEHTYERLVKNDRHREVFYQPVHDTTGAVVAVSIACKNIGLRLQAQQKVERQEQALWSFFELVPLPLKVVGPDLRIHRANAALADFLGYDDPDELQRVTLDSLLHPDDLGEAHLALNGLFEETSSYAHFECRYQHLNGETVWVNQIDFPLRGLGDEESEGLVLALSVDITRQKQAEQRAAQSERLRAIGELAAGVAHDFNNVLSIVKTYSQLIHAKLEQEGDHEYVGFTNKIVGAVDRAMALTGQLLTFGQEDEGDKARLDLNTRIHEISALLERNLGEGVDLKLELAADLPAIEIDPSQLDQVLTNLVINARDAMNAGGSLVLRTRQESKGEDLPPHPDLPTGDYALLEVEDEGEGMDEQTQRKIFEPFFTTKGRSRGTGLGLATVYRIVDRNGGYIYVDSELGCGTTFTIYFPASETGPDTGSDDLPSKKA